MILIAISRDVGALSGGQKRKLSLCLALIGRPPVVFLDEPTSGHRSDKFSTPVARCNRERGSCYGLLKLHDGHCAHCQHLSLVFLFVPGMDPYSRRATWNIIRAAREGRVVVLTTHFMDEARLEVERLQNGLQNGRFRRRSWGTVGAPICPSGQHNVNNMWEGVPKRVPKRSSKKQ